MKVMCECDSPCTLWVRLSKNDKKLYASTNKRLIIISDHCTQGPEPGDIVVKKGDGYMIYEEA
jgi:hypothetical protein